MIRKGMLKYNVKRAAAILTAAALLATAPAYTRAAETDTQTTEEAADTETASEAASESKSSESKSSESTSSESTTSESTTSESSAASSEVEQEGDDVVIKKSDKPYLALGADLSSSQKSKVLSLMGIDASKLEDYDVVTVTNKEEHEYLDSYISSSQIGHNALSSVVIVKTKSGSGLSISTYNITYCTVGMYKNALTTAGITDANIIVAGPSPISGTAALVGIIKAYEEMTGEEIDDTVTDAALDELVTTGELSEKLDGVSNETIEAIIAELKEKLANGEMETEEQMRENIKEVGAKYGITFDDDEMQQIVDLLTKLKSLNLDWDFIASQATKIIEQLKEAGSSPEGQNFIQAIGGGASSLFNAIAGFFKGLFSK